MKKKFNYILVGLISLCSLISCSSNEEEYLKLSASTLSYDSDDKYLVYLSDTYKTGIDFGSVSKEDIKIYFVDISSSLSSFSSYSYQKVECFVDTIRITSNNSLEVKFLDSSSFKDEVKSYNVLIENKYYASVQVVDDEVTLSSSVEKINSNEEEFSLTISSSSYFSSSFSREDITLKGSFKELEIDNLVIGINYFEISFKGKLVKDEDIYLDGIILIDKTAFKDSNKDQSINIKVVDKEIELIKEEINYLDNDLILPIKLNGVVDVSSINLEDLSILDQDLEYIDEELSISSLLNDLTIYHLEKEDDLIKVFIKLSSLSKKEALNSLNKKVLKVLDKEIYLDFDEPSFNVLLNSVEEKSDSYLFKISLNSINGDFVSSINKKDISIESLSNNVFDIKEVKFINKNKVNIEFNLIVKEDSFDSLDISLTLKKNSLLSDYNLLNEENISIYSTLFNKINLETNYELLSKSDELNEYLLSYLDIFNYSSFSSFSIANKNDLYLNLLSNLKSLDTTDYEYSLTKENNYEINKIFSLILSNLNNEEFLEIKELISSFILDLNKLNSLNLEIKDFLNYALSSFSISLDITNDSESIKYEKYKEYLSSLISFIKEKEGKEEDVFKNYSSLLDELNISIKEVIFKILEKDKYITYFDLLLSNICNFKSETYSFKTLYRTYIKYLLTSSLNNLLLLNGFDGEYISSNKEYIDMNNYILSYLDRFEFNIDEDYSYIYSLAEEVKKKMEVTLKAESNSSYLNNALIKGDLKKDKDGFVIKYSEEGLDFTAYQIEDFKNRLNYLDLTLEEELKLSSFEYTKKEIINSQKALSEIYNNFNGYHVESDLYHDEEEGPFAYDNYLTSWGVAFSSSIKEIINPNYEAILYRYDVIKLTDSDHTLLENKITSVYEVINNSSNEVNNRYVNVFVLK